MTARAREALVDCEHALADFIAGATTHFQRSRWIALMTLLRTVGLVLKAVDRPAAPPEIQRRIDDAWHSLGDTKPEPRIFHDFIDAERFRAVHLYEIRVSAHITVKPGAGALRVDREPGSGGDWFPVHAGFGGTPTTIDIVMRAGWFAGKDPRDLCRDAIEFWRDYLNKIDSADTSASAG